MAKTESTAVNDLIKIATTQAPLRQDPSDDLMFAVPSTKDRSTKQHALVPRGTDVPLPRARAPHGTEQNAIAMPAIKTAGAAASLAPRAISPPPLPRTTMSSRAISPPPLPRTTMSSPAISPPPLPRTTMSAAAISPPPLPRTTMSAAAIAPPPAPKAALVAATLDAPAPNATAPEFLSDSFEALATSTENPSLASMDSIPTSPAVAAIEPIRARATSPSLPSVEPVATRTTRPSLPSPARAPLPPLARIPMPSEYPIVSAVHSQPMAPAPQPTHDEIEPVWAEDSLDVDVDVERFHGDSTAQVPKPRTTLEWMIKLAPLAGAMILLGVFVGGYLVFDGQGGKQRAAASATDTVAAEGTVEVKVVADDVEPVAVAAPDSPAIAAPAAEPASETAVAAVTPPNLATTEPAAAVPVTPPNLAAPTPTAPLTAPAMPSITTPAPTVAALEHRTALVDIRIDSKPSGATVMLVDGGKQTFLGTTPISTAVDPSRSYDVAFSHPRRPTQTVHLDPKAANRLAVVLGRSGTPSTTTELAKPAPSAPAAKLIATPVAPTAVIAKPVATKPVAAVKAPIAPTAPVTRIAKPAKAPTAKIAEPAWDAQIEKAAKAEKPAPAAAAKIEKAVAPAAPAADKAVGGNGTLMISSKPPCEIHVDGTSTGLMTPQRSLSLPAGKHKITLVNPAQKIKKSVAVEITANESTKVIQDLTDLMK